MVSGRADEIFLLLFNPIYFCQTASVWEVLDAELTQYTYPFLVKYLPLSLDKQTGWMAYMDV
jgi:hypothetical protein